MDEFANVAPNLDITYNSTGSGTGKKEFGSGLTDFAGTDSTVKDGDGPAAGSFLYVPTVAAPITVSYNLPGVDKLQLSADDARQDLRPQDQELERPGDRRRQPRA